MPSTAEGYMGCFFPDEGGYYKNLRLCMHGRKN